MEAFTAAVQPVNDWFSANVEGGEEVLAALRDAVARAEAGMEERYAAELN